MLTLSKESQLKKLLIKNAVIIALVLMVMLAGAVFLSNYNDTVMAEISTKQAQNSVINSEYNDIVANMGAEDTVTKFYDNYIKDYNPDFTLNRDTITSVLSALCKKYHFARNIEVTISPIVDFTEAHMPLKSGNMVKSTVQLKFGALTDNAVYNLVYDLQHQLPGIVLVSDLQINRLADVSPSTVELGVKQRTIVPIVTGELSFLWIGIRSNPENTSTAADGHNNAR